MYEYKDFLMENRQCCYNFEKQQEKKNLMKNNICGW